MRLINEVRFLKNDKQGVKWQLTHTQNRSFRGEWPGCSDVDLRLI